MDLKVKSYVYTITTNKNDEPVIAHAEIINLDHYPSVRVRSRNIGLYYYVDVSKVYKSKEKAEIAFRPYLEDKINSKVDELDDLKALIHYAHLSDPESYVATEVVKRTAKRFNIDMD